MKMILEFLEKHFISEKFYLSFAFLVIAFVLNFFLPKVKWIKRETALRGFHFLAAGTAIAAYMMFVSTYIIRKGAEVGLVEAFITAAKMFAFEYHPSEIKKIIFGDSQINFLTQAYISFMVAFVPLITVTAVVGIFNDTAAQLKYGFHWLKEAHVFSELNEKSICLANDIRKHKKKALIVFTGVKKDFEKEDAAGLLSDAEDLGAIITRKSIMDFHCFMHGKPNVYLIGTEESNNVKAGIEIFKSHTEKACNIYVFSTLESAEMLVDAVGGNDKIKARIKLINYAQIVACDLLMKYPMYTAADKCGTDTMSVLVVGAGTVGMECAKAAMWCSRMDSYKFKIRIVDKQNKEDEFISRYGDLRAEMKTAGVDVDYDFGVADVNSALFSKVLDDFNDANYIIVATGNDELTINTASRIRKHFVRRAVKNETYNPETEPTVIPIITKKTNHEAMLNNQKNSDVYKPFLLFGSFSDVYCLETVTDWPVERLAIKFNSLYSKINRRPERAFHTLKQTEKRSNYATAVHTVYKIKDAGIDLCNSGNVRSKWLHIDRKREQLPEYLFKAYLNERDEHGVRKLDKLAKVEHDRWSVFHLLDGWRSWSLDDISATLGSAREHKLPQALLHGCIVPYNKLKEVGEKRYKDKNKFIKNDKLLTNRLLMQMPEFINACLESEKKGEKLTFYVSGTDGENT